MKMMKLSQLADDVEISVEESHLTYTVAELKREILDLGEPHHETSNWCVIKRQKWSPNANYMVESYIELEAQEMYEDWDERAMDCMTDEVIEEIQAILEKSI
ncbi:Uncharacterised protein [Niallia circulans]|uniref:hypothetical protein n=1 Tax=Niallia circulans TaxID=1397 RepID=UPI00077C50AA|nr:hypothetical protein [Niallia circulans]MED3839760.1 hypothetical protein [Niallia circulans]MED4241246.1 hypothetical protein [Niallia circulans]MED4247907.1 hypothetical protein [Niallia circulans]SPU11019.1 Uncharacterised protein [Niallia circulans]